MDGGVTLSAKELFIHMKDVPKWNINKHYYEQTKETLDFWENEKKKITFGVTIGGYFFHPWLYFHINFFRTPLPTVVEGRPKPVDKSGVPPFDDLILYILENYQKAGEMDKGLFLFGARGVSKSTVLASNTHWTLLTNPDGVHSIMGGNENDLKNITRLCQHSIDNITPAFKMPYIKGSDWETEITFGVKMKSNENLIHSVVSITNSNKGTSKSSEKGAGLSPVGYIFDEIGKFDFWKTYESAMPSFVTEYGYKLTPISAGTGGNNELSVDARRVMEDPEKYSMLLCDWEKLERNVPVDCQTWKEDKKKPFGTFMPGQMSYRLKVEKLTMKLSDFIGIPHKDLDRINIRVTDWETATSIIKEKINGKDEASSNKDRMYYPLTTSDCFLIDSENPFPRDIIERHLRYLRERGDKGKNIELYIQDGKQKFQFSTKNRSKIRHNGGVSDAPIVSFIDPLPTPPPEGTFVSGLDGYKLDVSETSSLGSMYILKRRNLEPNTPCETIAASYSSRPDKMRYFNQNCKKMLRAWGAKCLMESLDMGLQQFLEVTNEAQDFLCRTFTLYTGKGANSKLKSSYGIYPTKGNQEYMFRLLVDFTKEEHTMGVDEQGTPIIKTGIEFIEDTELLEEMLAYTKGGNFDRIDAFKHALTYARELDKKGYMPRDDRFKEQLKPQDSRSIDERLRSNKYGSQDIRRRLNRF